MTTITSTLAPTNKAIAATGGSAFGAALATLLLYALDPAGDKLPPSVAGAVTTIVTALVTLAAAYFTPPGASEVVIARYDGSLVSGHRPAVVDRTCENGDPK